MAELAPRGLPASWAMVGQPHLTESSLGGGLWVERRKERVKENRGEGSREGGEAARTGGLLTQNC